MLKSDFNGYEEFMKKIGEQTDLLLHLPIRQPLQQ